MLEPLFDAELDYQPGMPPLTSEGDGTLIGSGDGAVHGPKLTGKLEWTLFEQPGSTLCAMAPVARITTGDGAQILDQDTAIECGRLNFGALLTGPA